MEVVGDDAKARTRVNVDATKHNRRRVVVVAVALMMVTLACPPRPAARVLRAGVGFDAA
jgi:hypothetical protein